jgi:hypothetical protein
MLTWTSYSSSAFCRNCSAFCSGSSAPCGSDFCSFASAFFISAAACGSSSAIFLNDGSCSTRRLFIRVTRPSTCSRSRAWDSATTVEFSRSLSALIVFLSRLMLKVAAMIWRCCCESAPTS